MDARRCYRVDYCGHQTSNFQLPPSSSSFHLPDPASNFQLPTSSFQLPASNFQLPTSNSSLHATSKTYVHVHVLLCSYLGIRRPSESSAHSQALQLFSNVIDRWCWFIVQDHCFSHSQTSGNDSMSSCFGWRGLWLGGLWLGSKSWPIVVQEWGYGSMASCHICPTQMHTHTIHQ